MYLVQTSIDLSRIMVNKSYGELICLLRVRTVSIVRGRESTWFIDCQTCGVRRLSPGRIAYRVYTATPGQVPGSKMPGSK